MTLHTFGQLDIQRDVGKARLYSFNYFLMNFGNFRSFIGKAGGIQVISLTPSNLGREHCMQEGKLQALN